jgi:hypothetical protein
MIVACPCCSTRYRHAEPAVVAGALAKCSRCDETFPLTEPRRAYLVLPVSRMPAGVPLPVGMDDPRLADRIGLPTFEADPRTGAANVEPLGDDGWAVPRNATTPETTTLPELSSAVPTLDADAAAPITEVLAEVVSGRRRVWGPALVVGFAGGALAGLGAYWAGLPLAKAGAFALAGGLALSLARARWNRIRR